MSEQDIKNLQDLALEMLKKEITKEEALRSLVSAGILDENGDFTEPYKVLASVMNQ
jgi:hypothetical protein